MVDSTSKSIPFGIAQIGKAFRNEITPRNFIFRVREFEQMELEFFVEKGEDEDWHKYWIEERINWWVQHAGPTNLFFLQSSICANPHLHLFQQRTLIPSAQILSL